MAIEEKTEAVANCDHLLELNHRSNRDCYWLYVVTNCKSNPKLETPIKGPVRLPWHEVMKVEHYYLSVDALTQPMQVREGPSPYKRPENNG